jgi:hypothetical protein
LHSGAPSLDVTSTLAAAIGSPWTGSTAPSKLSERQLGSGIYADLDGKPVLVGLFTTSSKRGNVVFIQDVRGKELVTGH